MPALDDDAGPWPLNGDSPGGRGQRCLCVQARLSVRRLAEVGATPLTTGAKERWLGISKRDDTSLRKLLVHGARATIRWVGLKPDR